MTFDKKYAQLELLHIIAQLKKDALSFFGTKYHVHYGGFAEPEKKHLTIFIYKERNSLNISYYEWIPYLYNVTYRTFEKYDETKSGILVEYCDSELFPFPYREIII